MLVLDAEGSYRCYATTLPRASHECQGASPPAASIESKQLAKRGVEPSEKNCEGRGNGGVGSSGM
eukprot:3757026-Rhodomonas_salina.4